MLRPIATLPIVATLIAALLGPGAASALSAQDLIGSWHVLAHYKDSGSDHPDRERWVDRVWKFEWEGDTLKWTDYPIVVFDDETGRFERLGTNRQSRILHYWEPSEGQLANIRAGLEVNQRGSKSKTLEPVAGGWSSAERARPGSMNFLTYVETWSITGLPDQPVFERADSLSSGMTETLEGVTRYTAASLEEGGNLILGRYERDGSEEGTFRMRRTGGTQWVKGSGKTQSQRFREMAMSQYGAGAASSPASSPELEAELRETFEASLAANDITLRPEDMEKLADRLVALYQEGKTPEQIQKIMEEDMVAAAVASHYHFAPKDAVHDDTVRYRLPFDSPAPRQLSQGNDGSHSHYGPQRHAFDFSMPVGDPVVAARAGKVVFVLDEYERGGPVKSLRTRANTVIVLHEDGTFASYVHLSKDAAVEEGDEVEAGDPIGRSGNTGYTTSPHLHFAVWKLDEEGRARTVPIRFDDGSPGGFVPVERMYYGGPGWKASRE